MTERITDREDYRDREHEPTRTRLIKQLLGLATISAIVVSAYTSFESTFEYFYYAYLLRGMGAVQASYYENIGKYFDPNLAKHLDQEIAELDGIRTKEERRKMIYQKVERDYLELGSQSNEPDWTPFIAEGLSEKSVGSAFQLLTKSDTREREISSTGSVFEYVDLSTGTPIPMYALPVVAHHILDATYSDSRHMPTIKVVRNPILGAANSGTIFLDINKIGYARAFDVNTGRAQDLMVLMMRQDSPEGNLLRSIIDTKHLFTTNDISLAIPQDGDAAHGICFDGAGTAIIQSGIRLEIERFYDAMMPGRISYDDMRPVGGDCGCLLTNQHQDAVAVVNWDYDPDRGALLGTYDNVVATTFASIEYNREANVPQVFVDAAQDLLARENYSYTLTSP